MTVQHLQTLRCKSRFAFRNTSSLGPGPVNTRDLDPLMYLSRSLIQKNKNSNPIPIVVSGTSSTYLLQHMKALHARSELPIGIMMRFRNNTKPLHVVLNYFLHKWRFTAMTLRHTILDFLNHLIGPHAVSSTYNKIDKILNV